MDLKNRLSRKMCVVVMVVVVNSISYKKGRKSTTTNRTQCWTLVVISLQNCVGGGHNIQFAVSLLLGSQKYTRTRMRVLALAVVISIRGIVIILFQLFIFLV